jgi:polysaccharide export outer membrane protein
LTDFGDPKKVLVIRGSGANQKIYNVDLTSTNSFKSPVFQVKPNDMLVVQPQKRKFFSANVITLLPLLTSVNLLLTVINFLRR